MVPYSHAQNAALLVGRILISILFIASGIFKVTHWSETLAYVRELGIVLENAALAVTVVLQLLGGLFILFGYRTRLGVVLLLIFLLPVSFIAHAYWNSSASDYQNNLWAFWKNMSLVGGLFYVLGAGPGGWAIDRSGRALK